ncbi:MAG TPA: hypothetical protein DDW52_01915 [Planctomycetaceae bacterium]|nr:hypothetical protein [Planctomycetaceae bacterium]
MPSITKQKTDSSRNQPSQRRRKKRRKPGSGRRSLVSGVVLELATLLAIVGLARPDWLLLGQEVVEGAIEKNLIVQQSAPDDSVVPASSDTLVLPPAVEYGAATQQASAGVFPQEQLAVVIPAQEWLPKYFESGVYPEHIAGRPKAPSF